MLKTGEFDNIFFGFGGFHIEKIVLASTVKFFEGSRAEEVLVQTEIFRPGLVKVKHVVEERHCNCLKGNLEISLLSLRFK